MTQPDPPPRSKLLARLVLIGFGLLILIYLVPLLISELSLAGNH